MHLQVSGGAVELAPTSEVGGCFVACSHIVLIGCTCVYMPT